MFKFRSEVEEFAIEEGGRLRTIKRSGVGLLYGSIHRHGSEHISSFCLEPLTAGGVQKPPERQHLLHFIASTTSTSYFTLANPEMNVQYPGQIILYFAGDKCGMLFGDFETFGGLGPRDGRQREFILLSSMPGGRDSTDTNWVDPKFDSQGWFICNVMLIGWNQDQKWAERVATGRLSGDVWDTRLEVVSKHIKLA